MNVSGEIMSREIIFVQKIWPKGDLFINLFILFLFVASFTFFALSVKDCYVLFSVR